MRIKVGVKDSFAQEFILKILGGKKISRGLRQMIGYAVSGGGEREVIVFSLPQTQMGKKRFALKVGICDYPLPDWIHDITNRVVLVINQSCQRSLVREESHILGMLKRFTQTWTPSDELKGRGGTVIFERFLSTGRVLTEAILPKNLGGNQVIKKVTGFTKPVVAYGTTDAANVFELLQTLKAAHLLGLPAVFDSYDNAHTVGDYWRRVMQPSLEVINGSLEPPELGLDAGGRFTQPMGSQRVVENGLSRGNLKSVSRLASQVAAGVSFAGWYRKGMVELARVILDLIGVKVEFALLATEEILSFAPFWNISSTRYACGLEERTGHPVVAINRSDGQSILTNNWVELPRCSVAQLHQHGHFLGGAGLYWGAYSLGQHGGIIYTVKDSRAGQVHLLAQPYLEDPSSGLYLLPVGLFRMPALGQNEDWSIDPWIFLELLECWGHKKSRKLLAEIWQAMEIPLQREHIGKKTVATVSLDGIKISIS